jgi:hypothetical protein
MASRLFYTPPLLMGYPIMARLMDRHLKRCTATFNIGVKTFFLAASELLKNLSLNGLWAYT